MGRNVAPEAPWERRVFEDAMIFGEYGPGNRDLRELPRREFQAHLAIIEGANKKRKQENENAQSEARKAERKAS